jgi:hypothetical protein
VVVLMIMAILLRHRRRIAVQRHQHQDHLHHRTGTRAFYAADTRSPRLPAR